MENEKVAIIILSRKGSKRIPNKNFKLFCNKPLIHYTLDIAQKLLIQFDFEVYLYTDDENQKKYCEENFKLIQVKEKPFEFAQDKHDTNNEIKTYNKEIQADIFILLQPTSPVRSFNLLKKWIVYFLDNKELDSCISVAKAESKHYYIGNDPINFEQKRRDFNGCEKTPIYFENGSFFIFKKHMLKQKHVIGLNNRLFIDEFDIDLDTLDQWEYYENKYKGFLNENENNS